MGKNIHSFKKKKIKTLRKTRRFKKRGGSRQLRKNKNSKKFKLRKLISRKRFRIKKNKRGGADINGPPPTPPRKNVSPGYGLPTVGQSNRTTAHSPILTDDYYMYTPVESSNETILEHEELTRDLDELIIKIKDSEFNKATDNLQIQDASDQFGFEDEKFDCKLVTACDWKNTTLPQQLIPKLIGTGSYGQVYYGKLVSGKNVVVKVSCCRPPTETEGAIKEEIRILDRLKITLNNNPTRKQYFIEYIGTKIRGDLIKIVIGKCDIDFHKYIEKQGENFTKTSLVTHFKELALGLKFLHDKCNIYHGDFALRNILIENNICKISDYGMSRILPPSTEIEFNKVTLQKNFVADCTTHHPSLLRYDMNIPKFSFYKELWSFGILIRTLYDYINNFNEQSPSIGYLGYTILDFFIFTPEQLSSSNKNILTSELLVSLYPNFPILIDTKDINDDNLPKNLPENLPENVPKNINNLLKTSFQYNSENNNFTSLDNSKWDDLINECLTYSIKLDESIQIASIWDTLISKAHVANN